MGVSLVRDDHPVSPVLLGLGIGILAAVPVFTLRTGGPRPLNANPARAAVVVVESSSTQPAGSLGTGVLQTPSPSRPALVVTPVGVSEATATQVTGQDSGAGAAAAPTRDPPTGQPLPAATPPPTVQPTAGAPPSGTP